jgi:histidinol phosphatase-like enzyme
LALRSVGNAGRYGRVIEEQGRIVAFMEKDPSRAGPGIINGGIYVLKREILGLVHELPCSLEQDVFPALVERGEIRGKEFDGYFLDIGLPETLEQGHRELPKVRMRPAAIFERDTLADVADGDPEAFQWRKGAVEAIRTLNDRGYYVLVDSNPYGGAQSALPPGDGGRLNAAMQERLALEGAHVDRFASDPAIDAAKGKPNFSRLFEGWPIVSERSFWICVSAGNIEAARSAGISGRLYDRGDLARLVRSLLA